MDIKLELLRDYITDFIKYKIEDFDAIEEIVCIFEKYKIDAGSRHDF